MYACNNNAVHVCSAHVLYRVFLKANADSAIIIGTVANTRTTTNNATIMYTMMMIVNSDTCTPV